MVMEIAIIVLIDWRGQMGKLNRVNITISFPKNFNKKLKTKIKTRDRCTCKNCGITAATHILKYNQGLHIHHIDYNKTKTAMKQI